MECNVLGRLTTNSSSIQVQCVHDPAFSNTLKQRAKERKKRVWSDANEKNQAVSEVSASFFPPSQDILLLLYTFCSGHSWETIRKALW